MFSAIHKTKKFIEKISQYLLHCRSVLAFNYLTEPLKTAMVQWESLAGEPYLFRTFFFSRVTVLKLWESQIKVHLISYIIRDKVKTLKCRNDTK
jgi:hypothetical protein